MSINTKTLHVEFLEKITILQIKNERIKDQETLGNARKGLNELSTTWQSRENKEASEEETTEQKAINEALWEAEDAIREQQCKRKFGDDFMDIAHSIYFTNDKRTVAKKEVNNDLDTDLIEETPY
jgi:hypothetical protein